ncbi:MAG: molybdopterin-dependent oxidoreductase, partial [Deltaproteobacteria bacterium]|nr:molybdopterin-dependent oxidoreductase [Deltaproteobacteria bacterium]
PRPVTLPLDFHHFSVSAQDLSGLVGVFIKVAVDRQTAASCGEKAAKYFDSLPDRSLIAGYPEELLTEAAEALKASQRPVIVSGTDIAPVQVTELSADLALFLQAADKNAGLFYLLPGANAFGAGLLSDDEASMLSIIEAIENGNVKALVVVESDPFFQFPDRKRLVQALDTLDLLIVLDYLHSDIVRKAHIFIPTTTLYEADGIFVNQEGRAQMTRQAYSGGIPVAQSGGGHHPPRIYGTGIPGADPKPAWLSITQLADEQFEPKHKAVPTILYKRLADIIPLLADVDLAADIPVEGIRFNSGEKTDRRFTTDFSRQPVEQTGSTGNLTLIFTDLTFGTEELSSQSECLLELEHEPAVFMHTNEAQSLDLMDGDPVCIQTENGNFRAILRAAENMATGVLVVPRHRKLAWQIFKTDRIHISREQIKKAVD